MQILICGVKHMGRKLFCEICPLFYEISICKETLKRNVADLLGNEKIATAHSSEHLPHIVKSHASLLVRRLQGVDIRLQESKVKNIALACEKIDGIVIQPGETFSFWKTVGRATKKKGYQTGLVISGGKTKEGIGGGLCQMANMVHWLVLNSPLQPTELHHHSDALFPDEKRRVPFGTGTSVFFSRLDYRFLNNTDKPVQIGVWIEDGYLCGELRTTQPYPNRYKLVEENDHFRREGEDYYRISQVYKITLSRESGEEIARELVLDNHSRVMYDHSLIPEDKIKNDSANAAN